MEKKIAETKKLLAVLKEIAEHFNMENNPLTMDPSEVIEFVCSNPHLPVSYEADGIQYTATGESKVGKGERLVYPNENGRLLLVNMAGAGCWFYFYDNSWDIDGDIERVEKHICKLETEKYNLEKAIKVMAHKENWNTVDNRRYFPNIKDKLEFSVCIERYVKYNYLEDKVDGFGYDALKIDEWGDEKRIGTYENFNEARNAIIAELEEMLIW